MTRPARLLGVACVVLGGALIADPFRSLGLLVGLAAAAMILTGLSEVMAAESSRWRWLSRVVGLGWAAIGAIAAAKPGITIHALAAAIGASLVLGGGAKILSAAVGASEERLITGLGGVTNVIVGALALAWPGVTVLVLAVGLGVRTVVSGISLIVRAMKAATVPSGNLEEEGEAGISSGRAPRFLPIAGRVAALVLALGATAVSVVIHRALPPQPGAFYAAPSPLPNGPPGTIIRSQIITGFTPRATAFRVLYKSTGYNGAPIAVSGLIVVPTAPAPTQGRRVIAYTHGTVGVASNCAPSLVSKPGEQPLLFEGGAELLAAGYVVAATDYQGLGTRGPHPYLVGNSEAMNALDSVRAARNLAAAQAGTDFAVWGHSQGGHASLFTGQLAPTYAPELHLVGVAAGAPVPNLVDLFKVNVETPVGKILIAMAMQSWAKVYDDANLDQIVTPTARPVVARIAKNCLYNSKQIITSVPDSLLLGLTFLGRPPWETEPWRTIVARNDPGGTRTGVPILILQGDADPIVAPAITKQLAATLCGRSERVDLRILAGVAHLNAGQVGAPQVVAWIADRFAGKAAAPTCPSP